MLDSGALDHLSRLARLELSPDERERLRADLESILDYVAILQRTPTTKDANGPHSVSDSAPGSAHWRDDAFRASPDAADALSQAPERSDDYIAVPTVVVSESMLSHGEDAAPALGDHGSVSTPPGAEDSSSAYSQKDDASPVRGTVQQASSKLDFPSESEPAGAAVSSGGERPLTRSIGDLSRRLPDASRWEASSFEEILLLSAEELLARIAAGEISARSVVEACLARITRVEPRVNALVSVDHEAALLRAEDLDRARREGHLVGPLHGLPVVIKDNLLHRGRPLRCASRILERYCAPYSATAVERLEEAGAIVIGRANMDEFAMGSSCENSAFGVTANPWDMTRVPGGSSGGSAAAVASGEAFASLGSDTGGSVRQPGAFCGLVALKPRYGSVPRHGLVAFASSLDQIGPMGRRARDVALVYNAIQGADPRDATCDGGPAIDLDKLDGSVGGLRLGVPWGWLAEGVDPEVHRVLESTIRTFEKLGAEILAVELPSPQVLIATYYVIANAEASSNLARFDGVRYGRRAAGVNDLDSLYRTSRGEGFGVEVKRRILVGTFVLSAGYYDAYYGVALRVRDELREQVSALRPSVDAILLPTAPTPAFRLGEKLDDPLSMYLSDLFTIGANLIGNAAVTFPAGKSSDGLPIGMQLYGLEGVRASSSVRDASCEGSDGVRASSSVQDASYEGSDGADPRGGSEEDVLLRLVRAFELAGDGLGSLTDPASPLHTWGRA